MATVDNAPRPVTRTNTNPPAPAARGTAPMPQRPAAPTRPLGSDRFSGSGARPNDAMAAALASAGPAAKTPEEEYTDARARLDDLMGRPVDVNHSEEAKRDPAVMAREKAMLVAFVKQLQEQDAKAAEQKLPEGTYRRDFSHVQFGPEGGQTGAKLGPNGPNGPVLHMRADKNQHPDDAAATARGAAVGLYEHNHFERVVQASQAVERERRAAAAEGREPRETDDSRLMRLYTGNRPTPHGQPATNQSPQMRRLRIRYRASGIE